ncbi:hypothetical protein BT63DRAFT_164392 [Microthyrium microscopicum]|uniref:Uncharacterized protein n=1 Tax=Microthyrium microscopicum TaxID=703497 RepID=A0A6A6UN80_9PEZI|nr:hypothetical protein BT63DRAFT_164392 [Microthyrium microscopicum]
MRTLSASIEVVGSPAIFWWARVSSGWEWYVVDWAVEELLVGKIDEQCWMEKIWRRVWRRGKLKWVGGTSVETLYLSIVASKPQWNDL